MAGKSFCFRADILEQNTTDFEKPEAKNAFIQETQGEWIGFADSGATDAEELRGIIEGAPFMLDYDVLLFGREIPEGESNLFDLLQKPGSTVYALLFRRELLTRTGSYNHLLEGNCNYEFLLRMAEEGSVYAVPCSADIVADPHPETLAYIMRRYMTRLRGQGILDEVFLRFADVVEQHGCRDDFHKAMQNFLEVPEAFEKIASDTAPILVLVGDETCYGVVAGFANSLADALAELGQAVITTNGRYGGNYKLSSKQLKTQIFKAVVGFQSPFLESELAQSMKGPRLQFWFDNPAFSGDFFQRTSPKTYLLCQDEYYASYLKEHYRLERALQFPPGGTGTEDLEQERIWDLVFVGSYLTLPEGDYDAPFQNVFYQYMISHPEATFEQAVKVLWQERGIQYEEETFLEQMEELKSACFDVMQTYRHRVVETILQAKIPLHVFGDSWKKYAGPGKEHLILHPEVKGQEALRVFAQAKISLNIMNGHKGGMTERIANSMLCGACCLSDETTYLKTHFRENEEIVLYRGNSLEQLPGKIRYLLDNSKEREKIAWAGRERALQEHTWRKRAEEFLQIF